MANIPDIYVSPFGYVMFIHCTLPTDKTVVNISVDTERLIEPWVAEEIDPVAFKDLQ